MTTSKDLYNLHLNSCPLVVMFFLGNVQCQGQLRRNKDEYNKLQYPLYQSLHKHLCVVKGEDE